MQSLELKIEDVETFSKEVAKVAYEKACEVVAEEVRAMTIGASEQAQRYAAGSNLFQRVL